VPIHKRSILGRSFLGNQRGVALLVATFTVALVAFLAVELSYDTSVEYIISANEVKSLKAYYAAKAGIEVSLLRIFIYRQALKQFGEQAGSSAQLLEQIWKMPFTWPPLIPESASSGEKDQVKSIVTDSLMDAQYVTNIVSEGSKIDLNDLDSPSKHLARNTKFQIMRILQNRLDQKDDWALENQDLIPEEIVNNLIDWMDPDQNSLNGGAESSFYSKIDSDNMPPNQPFRTLEEIHMVDGMTDELYDTIAPKVTVYGPKGIQINHASKGVLMAIDDQITDEVAQAIIVRRRESELGPFPDQETFFQFLEEEKVDTQTIVDNRVPLIFEAEFNFRIQSIGSFSRSTREIIAITYDFDMVKKRLGDMVKKEKEEENPPKTPKPKATPKATPVPEGGTEQDKTGKPNVVYWFER